MSELRPCPFCGGKRTVRVERGGGPSHWIYCTRCHTCGPYDYSQTELNAIAAWNRREPDWERKWEGLVETTGARIAQDEAQKKAKVK